MSASGSILVVDDESSIREICNRVLTDSGYHVAMAKNGEEALSCFQTQDFDFVLTDIRMPGDCSGPELLEAIKQKSPTTDVVIITGFPALETAIPTLKNGAYDYLAKPIDKSQLLSVVARCFEKRRLSEELNREKKLRQELGAAYAQLQEMESLKEAFIARVNHELRIPLTPLVMALDQLREAVSDPKSRTLCELLQERTRRLQEVIENVLQFTDLRDPGFQCSKRKTNVHALLNSVIEQYRSLWEEKQLDVEVRWDPQADTQTLDPGLIETVYKNLFLNAIRFNRKNGKIKIEARKVQNRLEMSFADTGIGIPTDKLSMIFDSFYQVADYLTREVGGIGLGLTLVRRIVELHGGSVRIESRPTEGSVFTVILPLEQVSMSSLAA